MFRRLYCEQVKKCELCGVREADLSERTLFNGETVEISLCEVCYKTALKTGVSVFDMAVKKRTEQGKKCPSCGCTIAKFDKSYLFGCSNCYENMRETALSAASKSQGAVIHTGKRVPRSGGFR